MSKNLLLIFYSANSNDIRKHFLTKVSAISDVRIPKNMSTNKPRGFCYIELENQEDYEVNFNYKKIYHIHFLFY